MIEIIRKAKDIPIGETVSTLRGNTLYVLDNSISVKDELQIVAGNNTVFLRHENGNAKIINWNTKLIWYTAEERLCNFLQRYVK